MTEIQRARCRLVAADRCSCKNKRHRPDKNPAVATDFQYWKKRIASAAANGIEGFLKNVEAFAELSFVDA